jgi:hypothetical protein
MLRAVALVLLVASVAQGQTSMPAATTVKQEGATLRVQSPRVLLLVHQPSGLCDLAWHGGFEPTLMSGGFSIEIDGQVLRPAEAETETAPITDKLGPGIQISQKWGKTIQIHRTIHVYDSGTITFSGRVTNATGHDIAIGAVKMLDVSGDRGNWILNEKKLDRAPAAVYVAGFSVLACDPATDAPAGKTRDYGASQILALSDPQSHGALVLGFLTTAVGWPDVSAHFEGGRGGRGLLAQSRLEARKLAAGQTIDLDTVYLSADQDAYAALEHYGDAVAAMSPMPVRKGPTALWCSWYAHRMAMTEDLVLKNAEVAAKYFKPLGFEIMQLDHGWQKGDVTGGWVPNERFGHGLKWLADQLKSRFDLKLGLWIAPTDVADTTEFYKQHSDWMLKGPDGKPLVNWKWYWKPNPNCYELDASNPAAAKWIADTFARLTSEGASYFKIDFIAASGGEQFYQSDPYATRGWSVIKRAMESIRAGAGNDAWIRYCQPPPLLSVGLATSAYGGEDTYDAGAPATLKSLRDNARSLAAGYWINDRLYHREVCDMSVRMAADVEEARYRLAVMALAGCSISFSDELQHLPMSRIRMMQQVLPPGAPAMKPLDLWERPIPSIWHLHCKNVSGQWEVVGLFNWEDQEQERTVNFADLGLAKDSQVAAVEFWESKFLGVHHDKVTLKLPPHTSRILSLRVLDGTPQVIGTDMHVFQGYHELESATWDPTKNMLHGQCRRMPGVSGKVFMYVPAGYDPHFDFPLIDASAHLTHVEGPVWAKEIEFTQASESWDVPFNRK